MATYTTNLNLKKPAGSDTADIADINANMDTIDTAIAGKLPTTGTAARATADASGNTFTTFYQQKMSTTTVTLATSSWSGSGPYTKSVSVTGVTASNTVFVSPAPASFTHYGECGIYCSAQGSGTLTFTATTVPTSSLTVNVAIFN